MFVKHSTEGKIARLIIYMDDIILTGDDVLEMNQLKRSLSLSLSLSLCKIQDKGLGILKIYSRNGGCKVKEGNHRLSKEVCS